MNEVDNILVRLAILTSNISLKRKKIKYNKRNLYYLRRRIIIQVGKIAAEYVAALHSRLRSIWTLERHGNFWEKDVPKMNEMYFKNTFRMTRSSFSILCGKLDVLQRQDTNYRRCIPLGKRVAIALYTLKSSAEFCTVGRLFGISKTSVWRILHEFCIQVWQILSPEYLSGDIFTQEKVTDCVNGFAAIGFPQWFGAIDGCHIEIQPPAEEAKDYRNYKGWYSMVLLALVDYRYRFIYINVGAPGRCHDSRIFESSALKAQLQHQSIFQENARMISGISVPVVIIADSAFKLSQYTMKPYPFCVEADPRQKLFNYSLSKARRVVQNAFGHIKARFRRIGKGIDNNIRNDVPIIKCCCVLHNFLNEENDNINDKWLQVQRRFEESNRRERPEHIYIHTDHNVQAEAIRNALTTCLCSHTDSVEDSSTNGDDEKNGVLDSGSDELRDVEE